MNAEIHKLVDEILPEITEVRHHLHQNPELSMKEYETAKLIRERLSALETDIRDPFIETDVVALMNGASAGKNVTLRADMDALPVQEKTGLPYASRNDGVMHACGHDGHTAMLLGAALVLDRLRDKFNGTVRFVFQPGEETGGGRTLVQNGALLDPEPDSVIALHGWSGNTPCSIGSMPGVFMAAADFFKIKIKGKGAHGSRPEQGIDPILTGARVIEALQSIVSRSFGAHDRVVVSICKFESGRSANVIPDEAELLGGVRHLDPEDGKKVEKLMRQIVKGICDAMGAEYELDYSETFLRTVNDEDVIAMCKDVAKRELGEDMWCDMDTPTMGAEDFSFYIAKYPGAILRVGMNEGVAALHNPHFDFYDHALRNGITFLVAYALEALAS